MKYITLAHGSGGQATQQLINTLFLPLFDNEYLRAGEDQARLPLTAMRRNDRLAFSTDSYVIDPLEFPGGNIGKLAVCGTVNDIAVSGAVPCWLSCSFILEEGLPFSLLERIAGSMAKAASQARVTIVTGDTKVVPHGVTDKLFINTSGLGLIPQGLRWGMEQITPDDLLVVTGTLGDHGATILNLRENLGMKADFCSDCACLASLISPLKALNGVKTLRDATRGGVNAVLHEFSSASGYGMEIDETALPVAAPVRGLCELLGLDPLNFANEGKLVVVAAPQTADSVLKILHAHPLGEKAAIIGRVCHQPGVRIAGRYGVVRHLELPWMEPLPRIC